MNSSVLSVASLFQELFLAFGFWTGFGISAVLVGVIGAGCILIDGAIHKRRLRKMQRQTMEARQRENESRLRGGTRPNFLR